MTDFSNLESSNLWDYKPWWCQPWSILLTGSIISGGSWLILHLLWITVPVSLLVMMWWSYFLVVYPRMFKQYVESQLNSHLAPSIKLASLEREQGTGNGEQGLF